MKLQPSTYEIRELSIQDVTKRTSLKYSFNFKNYHLHPITDTQQIITRCQKYGTQYQIEFDGKSTKVIYYTHIIDDRQYWAFLNNEETKSFEGSFKLKFKNLIDEFGRSEEADWDINLGAGERVVKCLNMKEPFEKVSVSFTSSYVVK